MTLSHAIDALAQRNLLSGKFAERMSQVGYVGVASFFTISGFVIYRTSRGQFGKSDGPGGFLRKRLTRILPLYWIATALFFLLSPYHSELGIGDLVLSFALVPHAVGHQPNLHPLVGQAWTLQYEMLFYAIFCVGLFLPRPRGLLLIGGMLVALVAGGTTLMHLSDATEPTSVAQYWTRPILLLFLAGIGFGVLEERLAGRLTLSHPIRLMSMGLATWFALLWWSPVSAETLLRLPCVLVVWLLCAGIVFVSIFGQSTSGGLASVARHVGDMSYAIFLFHGFVLSALLRLRIQDINPALFAAATLLASILLGAAIRQFVERPLLAQLRNDVVRPPTAAT